MKTVFKTIFLHIMQTIFGKTFKKYIVFESVPDLSDNTKAVFDEMIRRGINKQYKMIWLVQCTNKPQKTISNVKYVSRQSKKKYYYLLFARCLISCNQKLHSMKEGQYSIYLGHGIPIKGLRVAAPEKPEILDNWLITSENVKSMFSYEFNMPIENGVALGYPRNDEFCKPRIDLQNLFDVDYDKIIVWYPTFRQNHGGISASDSNIALPIIHNEENARRLNQWAEKQKVLIVLKPHFAQDVELIKNLHLPYIHFIDDMFLHDNQISSYQFVNACDALLTDYSSIYFDFMLADRPIGLIWEDVEDYKKRPGFARDVESLMNAGVKIYTLEELLDFLSDVVGDRDSLKQERDAVCKMVHYSSDGKNSARVVDFILDKANL